MSLILVLAGDTVPVRSMMMSLQAEGFEVQRVTNGDELVNRFVASPPVGVLCDLAAPWGGLSLLIKRLRAQSGGKRYHLLLFGERPMQATDPVLYALGLREDDLFPEPVDNNRLARRLREQPAEAPGLAPRGQSVLGFPLKGRFDAAPVARLLSAIAGGRGTGHLELEPGGAPITLSFKDGDILSVTVTTGPLSLTDFLITRGRLQEAQRQELGRQGPVTFEALAAQGVVSPHEIPQLARDHAEAVIRDVVGAQEGAFRWNEGAQPRAGSFPLGLQIQRLILDGLKRSAQPLPEALATLTPALDTKQREAIQTWGLLPFELRVVNQLNGSRSIQSVVDDLSAGHPERRQELIGIMLALQAAGIVAPPAPPPEEAVDWNVRRGQLEQELERMNHSDPWEVLGTTQKSPVADVRARFFTLSKQFHPDRAFDAPPEVKELMVSLFRRVQEAYEIASDPKRKEEYLAGKDNEKAGVEARNLVQAEITFTQGELFLKNKNYAKARELFQQASELNPYATEYKIHLGWAMFLEDPAHFTEAAKLIHEAVKANPNLDRGYYFLGSIFKARNEITQAENAFKKAVAANANNVDAQRELRLLAMRREKGEIPPSTSARPADKNAAPAKKGLFGLFKKS